MTLIDYYMVDAFSDHTFGGNAAAVCPLTEWLPDEVMLKMAQQHNQSETAFFVPQQNGFALRWFTTRNEVNLCGHATLATAHVIFNHLNYAGAQIVFDTASGPLMVRRDDDWLTLNFPRDRTVAQTPPASLLRALGIDAYRAAHKGRAWLIELADREQVEAIAPDIAAMIPGEHKVTITAPGGEEYDFVSRFFSPGEAVWEDPVTGSAHTMLIPYWAQKLDKTRLFARQVSARGGDIRCELQGERVLMSGQAKTYIVGKLMLE
ncbi:isomerase [Superficieibacter electus]|uniref:Isomerase n=1 Tax=Superficieibacter electus TaxID=2022662 RepID=A0A2P5GTS9_9ENTR|nr:PhzF family phenazine biosynthesis protein [Superficieibacter electus]POP47113.1 isomerase [Superficieibacter electus]POP49959.1 isomerase [Superficieibacter electus]